jgi:hypothetical protein
MSIKKRRTHIILEALKALRASIGIWPKTRSGQALCTLALVFFAYSVGMYFGVPFLVRHLAQVQGTVTLHRSIQTGAIKFNPYTLRLSIKNLNIAEPDSSSPFIQVGHVTVWLSWTSLPHLALVVKRLSVNRPVIRIERLARSTFNFSDLIEGTASGKSHFSFAVSNLLVRDGRIIFIDRVLKKDHLVDNIQLAIPFIANLPTDADTYVRPRVQMTVDGSPFSMIGKTKPFQGNFESALSLSLNHLDMSKFIAYVANELPVKLKQAYLTTTVSLDFVKLAQTSRLQIAGTLTLENVAVHDLSDLPLVELHQLKASITAFDPLANNLQISSIGVEALSSHLTIKHDGTTNLTPLFAYFQRPHTSAVQPQFTKNGPASQAGVATAVPAHIPLLTPLVASSGTTSSGKPATPSSSNRNPAPSLNPALHLSIASFQLVRGILEITSTKGQAQNVETLSSIQLQLNNVNTDSVTPASYGLSAELKSGGRLSASGTVGLSPLQVRARLALADLDLTALQKLAPPDMPAALKSGQLSVNGSFQATMANGFNLHAEPAQIALDSAELYKNDPGQNVMGCKHLAVDIKMFDLASHQFVVHDLHVDGMHLNALRDSHGNLNLSALISVPSLATKGTQKEAVQNTSSQWQYKVESLAIESADASFEDETYQKPFFLRVRPLNIGISDLTSDLTKPFAVNLDGAIAQRGTFKIAGDAIIHPFQARLRITAEHIPVTGWEPLIARALAPEQINVNITKGVMAINAQVLAQVRQQKLQTSAQGDVRLGQVNISDKLTRTSFLRWDELEIDQLKIRFGTSKPLLRARKITLSDFYAALILNADGRLNLAYIVTRPGHPAVPITRPAVMPPDQGATNRAAADIAVGSLALHNGQVSFTDYFIKPHYSVFLTKLDGSIGAFGTDSIEPAEVRVTGKVNRTSPIQVTGLINPLAPMASLDIEGDAQQIELQPLTPYSTKYTGYPITGGTLTAEVHYALTNKKLVATNHLVLEQLTFGERVQSSSASNLPIRLAIAVLKDPQGRIDLRIPVSGSLSDPQFDLGHVIWNALENVIAKTVEAPFSILARAFGSEKQDLSYVEFDPGRFNLSAASLNKLEKLTSVLSQRPELKLRISAQVDPRLCLRTKSSKRKRPVSTYFRRPLSSK